MQNSSEKAFSGWALFLLWFLILVWFWTLVGAVFGFTTELAQGFPLWVLIGRVAVLGGLFASTIGLLGRKRWGVWGFFSAAVAMIPMSVSYSFFLGRQVGNIALGPAWILRNTLLTALVVVVLLVVVFWAVRAE